MMNFGQRIAHARKLAGLKIGREISQSELARVVGVKPQSIQSIEAGKVDSSRITIRTHRVLGVPLDWLESGIGDTPTEAYPIMEIFCTPEKVRDNISDDVVRIISVINRILPDQRRGVADMLEKMFPNRQKDE